VSSILVSLSRSIYDRTARVAGRPATVGDVVPLTNHADWRPRLEGLSADGSLFVVTVRPPDNRLVLVAVLERPRHIDDRWEAPPNTAPVTDLRDVLPQLVFDTGKGLTVPPEKLAKALQKAQILTAADEALLRAAIAATRDARAADAAAARTPPAGTTPTGGHGTLTREVDPEVERELTECAALSATDPAVAFGLALRAWRRTGWERLADLVERLASAGESEEAERVRARARSGTLLSEDWKTLAETLRDVDRGALLLNLHDRSAPDLCDLVSWMIKNWDPDPRVTSALYDVLRRKPWTYTSSKPTWTNMFSLLRKSGDRRLLAADWLERDRTRPIVGRSLHDWVPEQICKLADQLAATSPLPVGPEIVKLLDAIEQTLPAPAGGSGSVPPLPVAVPVSVAQLPATVTERANRIFTVATVVEAHVDGSRLVLGLRPKIKEDGPAEYPDAAVVYGPDGTLEWGRLGGCGAVALDPAAERAAVLTVTTNRRGENHADIGFDFAIVRLADNVTLASWRLGEVEDLWMFEARRIGLRIRWDLPSTVVGSLRHERAYRMYAVDADTLTLSVLDTGPEREHRVSSRNRGLPMNAMTGLAVDPAEQIVASHDRDRCYLHDARTGRLLQAFSVGDEVGEGSKDPAGPPIVHLAPVGGARFAFASNGGGAAGPGPRGSFRNIIDGTTGWCVEETPIEIEVHNEQLGLVRVRPKGQPMAVTVPIETAAYWGWSGTDMVRVGAKGTVRYRDPLEESSARPREVPVTLPAVQRVAVSADEAVLAASAGGGALIWAGQAAPVRVMAGVVSGITDLAISRSGLVAALMGPQVDVRRPDGDKAGSLRGGRSGLTRVVGCPAHDGFAVGARDGTVYLFDDNFNRIAEAGCLDEGEELTALAASPSGQMLAVGSAGGAVVLIDASGTALRRYAAGAAVRELIFLPGEDRVLVWTNDGRLGCLALADGQPLGWRDEPALTGIALHPRYGWLATARAEGQVTLHATADAGEPGVPVARHFGPVTVLAFATNALVVGAGRPGTTGSLTVYGWPASVTEEGTDAR
jgi:hypothetical protein